MNPTLSIIVEESGLKVGTILVNKAKNRKSVITKFLMAGEDNKVPTAEYYRCEDDGKIMQGGGPHYMAIEDIVRLRDQYDVVEK